MVPTIVAGGVLVVLPVSVVAGAACVGGVLVCSLCRWCPRVLPVSVVSSCAPCVRGVLVVLPGVGGVLVRIFTAGHPSGYTQGSSVRRGFRL